MRGGRRKSEKEMKKDKKQRREKKKGQRKKKEKNKGEEGKKTRRGRRRRLDFFLHFLFLKTLLQCCLLLDFFKKISSFL